VQGEGDESSPEMGGEGEGRVGPSGWCSSAVRGSGEPSAASGRGGGHAARDGGERGACGVVGEEKGGRHPFKGVWRGGSGGGESGQRGRNAAQGGRGGLAPTGLCRVVPSRQREG
jgi:hypothetical protein